jgi:predicted nicotinamide N-methyase
VPVPSLDDRLALVLARTRLQRPPAVPELLLHLADDMDAAWQHLQDELDAGELPPPYWAFAWLGGQAVARHVLDAPYAVAGRRVLDLACGSGLCAFAAQRAGAASVLAVDIDPFAEAAVVLNGRTNDLAVPFDGRDLVGEPLPGVDVVLAGDVCYDAEMTARMLPWLRSLAATGTRVLLGDPGRHYLPQSGVTEVAAYDVPTTRDLEGVEVKRVRVYALAG